MCYALPYNQFGRHFYNHFARIIIAYLLHQQPCRIAVDGADIAVDGSKVRFRENWIFFVAFKVIYAEYIRQYLFFLPQGAAFCILFYCSTNGVGMQEENARKKENCSEEQFSL